MATEVMIEDEKTVKVEFWVVAKQNPGASSKMFLPKKTSDPLALQLMQRFWEPGSGFHFTVYEDRVGAVRHACSFNYNLNQCQGIEYYVPVKVYLDGDKWCAVHLDFVNLQESDAGFGPTIEAAVADLNIPRVGTNQ